MCFVFCLAVFVLEKECASVCRLAEIGCWFNARAPYAAAVSLLLYSAVRFTVRSFCSARRIQRLCINRRESAVSDHP